MKLVLPYEIINNTPADAVPVRSNYSWIADFANAHLINRDGSVSMDAPLLLKGDPSENDHAANKGYVDGLLPIGIIMPYGGVDAPAGDWLLCDGSPKSTTTYNDLFQVLGYRYGGSGGNFNMPDMRGRFPVGVDATQTEFDATGKKGGTWAVPLANHNHAHAHTHVMPHTHEHPHTHTTNPATATTTASGAHQHNGDVATHGAVGGTNAVLKPPGGGTNAANVVDMSTTHTHTVDLPATTSAQPSDATTGQPSAASTGASSVTGTANAGTVNAKHFSPYVTVQYIIKAS